MRPYFRFIFYSFLLISLMIHGLRAEEALPAASEVAHVWNQTHKPIKKRILLRSWEFSAPESIQEWNALHACALSENEGAMCVDISADDPYFMWCGTLQFEENVREILVRLTIRSSEKNNGFGVYWTDDEEPNFTESRAAQARVVPKGGDWCTVDVTLETPLPIRRMRFDPSAKSGKVEIQKIELFELCGDGPQLKTVPMENVGSPEGMQSFPTTPQFVRVRISNPKSDRAVFRVNGTEETFEAEESRIFERISNPELPMERCVFDVESEGYAPIHREMTIIHDVPITSDWKIQDAGSFLLCTAPDDSMAFLVRPEKNERLPENLKNLRKIAAVAPLNPDFSIQTGENCLIFTQNPSQNPSQKSMEDDLELPAIHLPGTMQYAVVPGVELLEKGEWSSSKADLVTPEYLRIFPNLTHLTQRWMGVITTNGAFRLQWDSPYFQPTFAAPNYFDTTADTRFSLISSPKQKDASCSARLYVSPSTDELEFLEEAFETQPFQEYSQSEEEREALFSLYRSQLESGPIRSEAGWGHCAGKNWNHFPSADIASALWRIGGEVPDFQFVRGGAHVENNTIFFLRGQAQRWSDSLISEAENVLLGRQADGSWHYDGKYVCTHFENTALGVCVRPIWVLLQAYVVSGNEKYRDAALESLAYCRRFHVARGAQCWEMPLHTPDPLAAAYAIRSYVLAFRITGDPQYLNDARRWAFEGFTYMYTWNHFDEPETPESLIPWQYGAFIGVLGSTNWKAPLWMGRPVQWIGTVYAYALFELYDEMKTFGAPDSPLRKEAQKWRIAAEAITHSAEQQIYQDGEFAGLLPDSVDCMNKERYPWNINPAVPIALRLRILNEKNDGVQNEKQESVRFFMNSEHCVVSPFPAQLESDGVRIFAPDDVKFQLILDGKIMDAPEGAGDRKILWP